MTNELKLLYLYVQTTLINGMGESKKLLNSCLYFAANSLSRVITRMADEEFRGTGLSPSHAFLVVVVIDNPGIEQKEIGCKLKLAPSTVTRFIDTLEFKGVLMRKTEGKISRIYPTEVAKQLIPEFEKAWKALYNRYSEALSKEEGDKLTKLIFEAATKLEKGN